MFDERNNHTAPAPPCTPAPHADPSPQVDRAPPPSAPRAAGRGSPAVVRGGDRLAEFGTADARGAPRAVVLVDFWTYTCVNWLRTLPYVRAWAAKYADPGVTTIGVHTPEFGFEHDVDNVVAQARALRVPTRSPSTATTASGRPSPTTTGPPSTSPMPGPHPLPPLRRGRVRDAEMVVQQLLLEAGADDVDRTRGRRPVGLEVAADYRTLRSPETYLGYGRATGFASPERPPVRSAARLPAPPRARPQPVGAGRRLDDGSARGGAATSPVAASRSASRPAT